MPAALRLAERLRLRARPRRRHLPAGAGRPRGAGRAPLPARDDGAGDELGDERRLDHRARRPPHRPLAPRARPLPHAPPGAHRLRRRPRAAAPDPLRERRGAGDARLRAALRLRPPERAVGVQRAGLSRGRLLGRGLRRYAQDHLRHEPRLRGAARHGPDADEGGRHPLRGARLVRAPGAEALRGGLRPARLDCAPLAALARPRAVPGPSVAHAPAARRADAEGALVRADGRPRRRGHHVAARDARRRAQLGLPLHLDPRRDLHALGPLHARLRLGGERLLLLHRGRRGGRAEPAPDHVRHRRRGHAHRAHARSPVRLRGFATRAGRERRVQPGAARRLGRPARLRLPAHEVARPPARAHLADPEAPGRDGTREVARTRPRHLGGARRAAGTSPRRS